ncbi:MAG: hypothetical protein WCC69_09855 [Pirellulales bacterium]
MPLVAMSPTSDPVVPPLPIASTPADTVVPPVNEFDPVSVKV